MQAVAMTGGALTIGRAEGNDLVLPDPERVISSRHCVLEARGGDYVLIDISTNGTFLNYSAEPVGPVPAPVNHGDVISIGRYELRVEIEAEARRGPPDPYRDLPPPLGEEPVAPEVPKGLPAGADFLAGLDDPGAGGRDFLDDLLGEGPKLGPGGPARAQEPEPLVPDELLPLGEPAPPPVVRGASVADHSATAQDHFRPAPVRAPLIPDDWDDEILGPGAAPAAPPQRRPPVPSVPTADAPPRARPVAPGPGRTADDPFAPEAVATDAVAPAPVVAPEPPPARAPVPAPAPRARPEPASPPRPAPVVADPARDAARAFLRAAGAEKIEMTEAELVEVMARLGETFRILVAGLREVLIARASIKNEFRLSQTVISVEGNNPMKFSISAEQAIEAMVRPAAPGYLPAPEAARQALDDIKAHEVAMMSGMQAAIQGLLKRFDPERLASQMESRGISGLLGNRKARYWDAFETLYGEIAREAEDDFQALFGKEFARAYQAQLRKL
jgi:type VI secretion system FHA domain protein